MGNKNNSNEKNKVRYAKAYGVKSNIVYNDTLYTTTFGNKNESVVCKVYDKEKDKVNPFKNRNTKFGLNSNNKVLTLSIPNGKKDIKLDNISLHSGTDILGIKQKYNTVFFGKEYPNDTIHTQIAYNILDINKIASLYFYNVVYCINNLSRNSAFIDDNDIVGQFSVDSKFENYKVMYNDKNDRSKDISSNDIMYRYSISKNQTNEINRKIAECKNYIDNQKKNRKYKDLSSKTQQLIDNKKEELKTLYEELKKINEKNPYINIINQIKTDNYKQSFFVFNDYAKAYYTYYPMFETEPKYNLKKDDFENDKASKESIINNYNVLRTLSFVRQSIGHSSKANFNKLLSVENNIPKDLKEFVDSKFDAALTNINRDFSKNAKLNLNVISYLLNVDYDDNLLNKYYKFSLLKENKNLGIKTTRVREELYDIYKEKYHTNFSNNKYNSYRSKINLIYDYLIYDWLENKTTPYVERLRETQIDEEKDVIYKEIANRFLKEQKEKLFYNGSEQVTANIDHYINDEKPEEYASEIYQAVKSENFSTFSKIIYFISTFLEKKEKNDLITALINKFDNIDSLNKVYRELSNKYVEYEDDYHIFKNASKISNELRIIKNLSHMNKMDEDNSGRMYIDALKSLGCKNADEEYKSLIENEFKHPFRNFISNNIIQSKRFVYIIKYTNPESLQDYIKCEKLIKSILFSIPETQLKRYCKHFYINENDSHEIKVNQIYNQLKNFNYEKLCQYNCEDKSEAEDLKSLVNLYYTVVYIAIKNLVNINSIFILGFEALERDYEVINDNKNEKDTNVFKSKSKILSLLKTSIDNYYVKYKDVKNEKFKKRHDYEYLNKYYDTFNNIPNMNDYFKKIRNEIMHMSFISKTSKYLNDIDLHYNDLKEKNIPVYYELYVYVLENEMLNYERDNNGSTLNDLYGEELKKYHTYNKNFLHILLTPLAYNLARYKNITIRELFYDKYNEKSDFE
jgi:hypothetical protein